MANRDKNFKYALAVDFETTGVCMGQLNPVANTATGERHQAVSAGILVVDMDSLEIVDERYLEIKWNEESKRQLVENPSFGKFAEKIHGLTIDHLEDNGIDEEEAVEEIANLVVEYWGLNTPISMMGHNVYFDRDFLHDMFSRHKLPFRFSQRNIDSFSIGIVNWRAFCSDELFDTVVGTKRTEHNALEDIKLTLEAIKTTRFLFERMLNNK